MKTRMTRVTRIIADLIFVVVLVVDDNADHLHDPQYNHINIKLSGSSKPSGSILLSHVSV